MTLLLLFPFFWGVGVQRPKEFKELFPDALGKNSAEALDDLRQFGIPLEAEREETTRLNIEFFTSRELDHLWREVRTRTGTDARLFVCHK